MSARNLAGVYLALETSGAIGSVAVARGARVLARVFLMRAGEQASQIVPGVQRVLDEAAVSRAAIAGVVVGAGPGSFTGVRIAAATGKGIAHALGVPMWAFSSLAAGALSDVALPPGAGPTTWWTERVSRDDFPNRYVLFDARGERVFAACYRLAGDDVHDLVPGHFATITELLESRPEGGLAFVGDGALRHRGRLEDAGRAVIGPPAGIPTADALLRLLFARAGEEPVADAARWEPEYLKAPSAESERLAPRT